ncbi:hypothetical protein ACFQ5J_03125 [Lacticaseibacillus baoqingensis]|uniref:Fructose permease n=1 Tax=Lacticaseibacillus baoqingensis TaxID=2486013 RepID=A0ABW4E6W1_9LACO|nr:hypothetical protein [Lacticaseibacillus baoqingensis]
MLVNQVVRPLTKTESVFFLCVSILINAIGNALTVCLNLGSAMWTASSANLSYFIHVRLDLILIGFGTVIIVINCCLRHRVDWGRIAKNFIFMIPFSLLVQVFADAFSRWQIQGLSLGVRIGLDLFGIVLIGMAVSIYQRVNVILHPNDDFMQTLRFDYCHGNAALAMWASYIPPAIVLVVAVIGTRQILAINIGTAFSLALQGSLVGWSDKLVFPRLKHQL